MEKFFNPEVAADNENSQNIDIPDIATLLYRTVFNNCMLRYFK